MRKVVVVGALGVFGASAALSAKTHDPCVTVRYRRLQEPMPESHTHTPD